MKKIKIVICGSKGRVGHALVTHVNSDGELELAGETDRNDDLTAAISGADVVIDFTSHTASAGIAKIAAQHKKALVLGTTGHSKEEKKRLLKVMRKSPVVWSSNFSTGVNVLFYVTGIVAKLLGRGFDVEITEVHHKTKKDAPSGTAKRLQDVIRLTLNRSVPAHSLRVGDVIGEHTVIFAAPGERLELAHCATSRDTFACGALQAAKWVVHQKPGIYDMQDVLKLR